MKFIESPQNLLIVLNRVGSREGRGQNVFGKQKCFGKELAAGLQAYKNLNNLEAMNNEELEMRILLRQNTELVAKLQWYRRENQELKSKNANLNIWVQNLSEVFSAASASWQSITLMEESLMALMRRKSDMKDKTLLRKYIFHFKTFAGIIDNLAEKIMNEGHSDQSTLSAKEQLDSFVKNYEIFFKEFVETYFKFNDDSLQLLNELKSKPEAPTSTKLIATQALEQKHKVKQFESFMEGLKENFKIFQEHNSMTLLSGAIIAKEEEIKSLKQTNYTMERRFKAMFDYNSLSVESQLEDKEIQCFCGAAQLCYMKKQWEKSLKNMSDGASMLKNKEIQEKEAEENEEENKVSQEKYTLLEEQREALINRNKLLLEKIDKMKVQSKLTDEMILKSNVYLVLKEQCQYLMDYVSDLLGKTKKNQDYLMMIEKNREDEIIELKKKFMQHNKMGSQNHSPVNNQTSNIPLLNFKADILNAIKDLRSSYHDLIKSSIKPEQVLASFRSDINQLSKTNHDLHKKLNEYYERELEKNENLEFRHEKFKIIESEVNEIVAHKEKLNPLWKQFINYVKGRDKKIKDLQGLLKKKEKEIIQKTKIAELVQETLDETQKMYNENKTKLDKTQEFINKMEQKLNSLAEQNFNKKAEFEQEKTLLTMRLKSEIEARGKLEEKVSVANRVEDQIREIRKNQAEIHKNYHEWVEKMKNNMNKVMLESNEKDINIKSLQEELIERQKQLSKLQGQKQTNKSEIRQLQVRVESLLQKSEDEVMRLELEDYKGKITCSCGNRERDTVLKTCPHLFCKKCIDDTQNSRNRKCPLCGIKFTKTDIHEIKWN